MVVKISDIQIKIIIKFGTVYSINMYLNAKNSLNYWLYKKGCFIKYIPKNQLALYIRFSICLLKFLIPNDGFGLWWWIDEL